MSEPRPEGAETRSNRIFEWIIVASILLGGGLMLAHQALLWREHSSRSVLVHRERDCRAERWFLFVL